MVYRGPSTGCGTCRHRRVKCDETKPHCLNCEKRSIFCTGYDRFFDRVHRNQNATVRRKAEKADLQQRTDAFLVSYSKRAYYNVDKITSEHPWLERTLCSLDANTPECVDDKRVLTILSSIPRCVSRSFEIESTDMFLAIYCGVNTSKRAVGGIMHYLRPMVNKTRLDSPLHKAVTAVAVNMAVLWSNDMNATSIHRQYYGNAINSLREVLYDPSRSRDDDVLMAVLIMDFCDALNTYFRGDIESKARSHQTGALALVKHRGPDNFKNETSKAMMTALQNGVIHNALQRDSAIPSGSRDWFENPQMPPGLVTQLDTLTLPLTELLSRAKETLQILSKGEPKSHLLPLINELNALDRRYVNWHDSLPKDCEPRLLWGNKIQAKVRRAGVYRDQCSVYVDLPVANVLNLWRMRRIRLLRMLKDCTLALQSYEDIFEDFITSEIDQTIQNLVDGVCDSIPFFMGDYLDKVPPLHHSPLTFPCYEDENGTVPEDPKNHIWHATCAGGWLILTVLINLTCFCSPLACARPLVLRPGQSEWISSQLDRLEMAWKLPMSSLPTSMLHPTNKQKLSWISMAHDIGICEVQG